MSLRSVVAREGRLVVGFGVVTLVAAAHAVHDLLEGYSPWHGVHAAVLILGQCAALTVGYSRAARRKAPLWSLWVGGALISAVFGTLLLAAHHPNGWHVSPPALVPPAAALAGTVLGSAITGLWLLVFQLPLLVERARLHALEVESLRREAELSRLRVHLHPHFLINTLNAIAGLVNEAPDEACRLIAALGDLVREALSEGDELRPFGTELAWLRRYAEILEARHRGFVSFRWEIAEETLATLIPRLLLQPLVENAVKHGTLHKRDGGTVLVRSETLDGGAVRFVVEDDGPGLGPHPAEGLGIGLVRRRLALMRPAGHLHFVPTHAGTRVEVEIRTVAEGRA